MNDLMASIIRTTVPLIVGWVANMLLQIGVEVDSVSLSAFLTSLLGGLYYVFARWAEQNVPWLQWLLVIQKTPSYGE